jgi:hypothetical protein
MKRKISNSKATGIANEIKALATDLRADIVKLGDKNLSNKYDKFVADTTDIISNMESQLTLLYALISAAADSTQETETSAT